MVVVIVTMAMTVSMTMVRMMVRIQTGWRVVAVNRCPGQSVQFAKLFIATGRIAVSFAGTIFQSTPDTFDMVMMAFLGEANLIFKPQNLLPEFAHLTIHDIETGFNLVDPVFEG